MRPAHVVLYDRDCGFCRWSLAKLLRWDRAARLRPVALQDPEADALLGGMEEERKMASWHLVELGGRVHSGGTAAVPLLRLLPRGRPLAALLGRFPRVTDAAYGFVSDHRSTFSRLLSRRALERADVTIAGHG